MTETVLVTGGTGFVARWCVAQLREQGYAVRVTARRPMDLPGVDVVRTDLTRDDGWDEAVAGCDYVLHVASPLGTDGRADPEALTAAAREGTLRVLRAATAAGVKRVVMTSSTAAATPAPSDVDAVAVETVWTDVADRHVTPYRRSKVLAERAAWDFMDGYDGPTTLTTILPVAVFGPVLSPDNRGSVEVIQRLLTGRPPVLPRFGFSIVDVRDLADLHIRAMTAPEAAGERFIAAGEFMWLSDIARTLRARLGDRAAKVPTRGVPDGVVRLLARVVPPLRTLTPLLGRHLTFDASKAVRVLGFAHRPAATTVVECAASLATAPVTTAAAP